MEYFVFEKGSGKYVAIDGSAAFRSSITYVSDVNSATTFSVLALTQADNLFPDFLVFQNTLIAVPTDNPPDISCCTTVRTVIDAFLPTFDKIK